MKTALLVIDVQNALVEGKPYNCRMVISNIKSVLEKARSKNIEVIYVQHQSKDGSALEKNSEGWKIYHEIAPITGEKVIGKKFNSSFRETELKDYLDDKGITNLIMTGMQTEYCIDTSCRVAFEYGYKIIIPEMTNTTFDNGILKGEDIYKYHNYKIFKDRFAEVMDIKDITELN